MTYAIAYPIVSLPNLLPIFPNANPVSVLPLLPRSQYAYWVNVQTLPTTPDEETAPLAGDAALPSFRWPAVTTLQAVLVFALGVATSGLIIVAGRKFSA
ncbi:hypothetical protein M427DRAFT_58964 [Gonapodya prolifera JEL478]|uniref:Uncharacterized protein n=1 Tax=Gonapodya prolifera (strain JEL478) TaxID=1344416 RepID=A0A139A8D9_GONPJ|nr:hypothetical protein M427DRAFT_58964 [Gonapodya prolifera JEL478]|eukprot:KXS13050.1 hypothetical protein M427DRAFT_58964 [Gonapodya prolifera JEL478]